MTTSGREHIPSGVVRVIEVVGSSPNSFSDAVRTAVKTASETLRNIRGVEVISSNADVDEDGNLTVYKVTCKIAFIYQRGSEGGI
jgi:flavin-binding protein dodecin